MSPEHDYHTTDESGPPPLSDWFLTALQLVRPITIVYLKQGGLNTMHDRGGILIKKSRWLPLMESSVKSSMEPVRDSMFFP